jgi:hypothetical protein
VTESSRLRAAILTCNREHNDGEAPWKPIFVLPLKVLGGIDMPCSKLNFHNAPYTNRPVFVGSHDGELVPSALLRPDSAQVPIILDIVFNMVDTGMPKKLCE